MEKHHLANEESATTTISKLDCQEEHQSEQPNPETITMQQD
jgi:hypothetical protein